MVPRPLHTIGTVDMRRFVVQKDGLTLELAINGRSSDVQIAVHRDGIDAPVISIDLARCSKIRVVKDKYREDCLEFESSRIKYLGTRVEVARTHGVRLFVEPSIRLDMI